LPSQIHGGAVDQILVGDWEDSITTEAEGPESTTKRYLVSIKTASLPEELGVFSSGRARVKISPTTLLSRLNQQLQHTFQYR